MRTLIVHVPGPPGEQVTGRVPRPPAPQRRVDLEHGQEKTFGRGVAGHPVDIPLADPGISRIAGRIRAVEDYWLISNLSRDKTYLVENPEGGGEFIKVAPRRLDMPVPFEFARVILPAGRGQVSFTVFAPEHSYACADTLEYQNSEQTLAAFPLDETAKYFFVLLALCEPRLRDSSTVMIPTVPEIVDRLRELDGLQEITRTAVNFHIDYLARSKLRVKVSAGTGQATRADWQREALVCVALRFNLVREEHLMLLPRRRSRPVLDQPAQRSPTRSVAGTQAGAHGLDRYTGEHAQARLLH